MMRLILKLTSILFLLFSCIQCGSTSSDDNASPPVSMDEVTYTVTLTNLWNAGDHAAFPGNAHFSPLFVAAHNQDYDLFSVGSNASAALEELAETGVTAMVVADAAEKVSEGSIASTALGENFFPEASGDSIELTITVSAEHPYISLATMIAPSPDWIVGVDSVLMYSDGAFEDSYSADLYALDAGTEQGDEAGNFSINNDAEPTHKAISQLTGDGFDAPFARISIVR